MKGTYILNVLYKFLYMQISVRVNFSINVLASFMHKFETGRSQITVILSVESGALCQKRPPEWPSKYSTGASCPEKVAENNRGSIVPHLQLVSHANECVTRNSA